MILAEFFLFIFEYITLRNWEYLHKLKLYCFSQFKMASPAGILAIPECTMQISKKQPSAVYTVIRC